jgi:hypothetical protein
MARKKVPELDLEAQAKNTAGEAKREKEKLLTWTDIEISLKNSLQNSPGETETEAEKLAYFKKAILSHLDNLQAEEDKKVIPFPNKKQKKQKE